MKKLLLLALILLSISGFSQNFVGLASDASGDDFYADAKEISYALSPNQDTLFVKIEHFNARGGDFGYAIILDTNLNVNDGFSISQGSIKNQSPNTSMTYDVALYAYQNGFFPGVYTEAYGSNGSPITLSFDFDTANTHYGIFSIPLNSIGGNLDLNMIAFTGSFDISPAGAGPTDAMPDNSFVELRTSTIGLKNYSKLSPNIFPIPAYDKIYVQLPSNSRMVLELLDLSGKKIVSIEAQGNSVLDVSRLPKGQYILLSKDGTIRPRKVWVQ